jgi:hypothetical protein
MINKIRVLIGRNTIRIGAFIGRLMLKGCPKSHQ